MHQSVADPKYEGVRTSRKQLMEDEEDDSGDELQDDEESYHEEDEDEKDEEDEEDEEDEVDGEVEEDGEESKERRVRFEDMPSEKQPWKSNETVSDDDIPSESEVGSEESEREQEAITRPSNQPSASENVGPTEDVSSTIKRKREEDLEKGQTVKRQVVRPFTFCTSVSAR